KQITVSIFLWLPRLFLDRKIILSVFFVICFRLWPNHPLLYDNASRFSTSKAGNSLSKPREKSTASKSMVNRDTRRNLQECTTCNVSRLSKSHPRVICAPYFLALHFSGDSSSQKINSH
ncbi:unnamed protein product, partial [Larinioides sclopetarius]